MAETAPRGAYAGVLSGFEATMYLFKKYENDVDQWLDNELEDLAHAVLGRALYYCPETQPDSLWAPGNPDFGPGYLRSTGQVVMDGQHRWSVIFGAWYAAYVHEIPTYYHAPPTRWKFLEVAVKEAAPEWSKTMTAPAIGVRFRSFAENDVGARSSSGYPFALEGQA